MCLQHKILHKNFKTLDVECLKNLHIALQYTLYYVAIFSFNVAKNFNHRCPVHYMYTNQSSSI